MKTQFYILSFPALLIFSAAARSAFAIEEDPQWYACQSDADCEISSSFCGEHVAVNKVYEKEARDEFLRRPESCRQKAFLNHSKKPVIVSVEHPACAANKCKINTDAAAGGQSEQKK